MKVFVRFLAIAAVVSICGVIYWWDSIVSPIGPSRTGDIAIISVLAVISSVASMMCTSVIGRVVPAVRNRAGVYFSIALPLAVLLLELLGNQGERKYRSILSSVSDVEEVTYLLYYEEHTSADLNLTEGRYLHINEFDEGVATSTDQILLSRIGDLKVSCSATPQRDGIVGGGLNILDVMASSSLQLELRNISDVISHYGVIYDYLEQSLPLETAEPKQLNDGRYSYWCWRSWSTERPND